MLVRRAAPMQEVANMTLMGRLKMMLSDQLPLIHLTRIVLQ